MLRWHSKRDRDAEIAQDIRARHFRRSRGRGHLVLVRPASPQRGRPLTRAEIAALVSGNTLKGPRFSEYYAPDSSIRGREIEDTDEEYLSIWRVDGDQLCVAFPSHDYKSCVLITSRQGEEYDFADAAHHATHTIIAGNPNDL